jgi:hypothetical protein
VCETYAFNLEALPFCALLDLACGGRLAAGDTAVDEVSQHNERQCQSNHRSPSFILSSDVDSHVTAQMLVLILALEVGHAGVNVSFISIVDIFFDANSGHDITSFNRIIASIWDSVSDSGHFKSDLERNGVNQLVGKSLENMEFSHSQTEIVKPAVIETGHNYYGANFAQSRIRPVVHPVALELVGQIPYGGQYCLLKSLHCASPKLA